MQRLSLFVSFVLAVGWVFDSRLMAQNEFDAIAERGRVEYSDVPRKVLAFYYPWYGNPDVDGGSGQRSHWSGVDQGAGQIASSTQYPSLGPYDSHDPKLIGQHCAWAKQAGVDGFIVSWWGKGSFSDRAMERILDGCKDAQLSVTIYYETVPRPKDAQAAAQDVLYLLNRYGDHPAWLCVDGKPVVFVYGRAVGELGLIAWSSAISQVNRQYARGAVFVGDRISRPAAAVFDGVHTYNTAGALRDMALPEVRGWAKTTYPAWVQTADAFRRISTLTVIPGYDDTKIRKPGLRVERAGGALYRCQWEEAVRADPHWILITSWNEWHEGSEIEPSVEYEDQYLKLTAEFAARFKRQGKRPAPADGAGRGGIGQEEKRRLLAKLAHVKIGLLPDAELTVVWPLLELSEKPAILSWEEVAEFRPSAAEEYPVLIYAAGERYRRTVSRPGDVDEGLLRYLKAGGLLVVLPAGPMPFHYDEEGNTTNSSRKLGLPLSVGGQDGGWEQPPQGVKLRFVQVAGRLPHLPESFPFPETGDRRWRPLVRSRLAEGDLFVPLVELRDDQGRHYGDAAAYVQHKAGEPAGGKVLYVWFGLVQSPLGEQVIYDVLAFIADKVPGGVRKKRGRLGNQNPQA